jgi:type II secretory pathway pseudopilin PulG
MKKLSVILILVILVAGIIYVQQRMIRSSKAEISLLKSNQHTLLSTIDNYKTRDSLHVASVSALQLSLFEYKQYRAADADLIATLKADRKRLQTVVSTQTETIRDLKARIKDSVVVRVDSVVHIDTIPCFNYSDTWINLTGCIDSGVVNLTIKSYESLLYVEHVVPRRFLFFKFGVKERRQEIVSKNPYTTVRSAEYIRIRE